jgi:glycosyltransferase involved in cell wall biosynthesis
MKFKIFGWRNPQLDQISRIEEGLINNGCELDDNNPDIVYSNNDMYDDILDFANRQNKKPKIILNVLDLQLNNPTYNLNKVKHQLLQADVVTCISETVKKQIYNAIGLNSHVVYNPIKDIQYNETSKDIPFLYVGRANDSRKRFSLIRESLSDFEQINEGLVICGSENPYFGRDIGIVDNETLNRLYNISKFLLLPSSFEGLGLPMIEAMVGGCIPITCSDNETAIEFSPQEFICNPDSDSFINKLIELNNNYSHYQQIAIEYGKKYLSLMNKNQVAKNIIDLC